MASLRTTNVLLVIIAACLCALTVGFTPIFSEARAQAPAPAARMIGCSHTYTTDPCKYVEVLVTPDGRLRTSN